MTESRLQRWARKKAETQKGAPPAPESPAPQTHIAPDPAEQALAVNQELTEQEILTKYNLPDPNAIELGTDITGFLRKEIPEFIRRKALRSLWRSNPVFSVLDGLNEYDEDFSKATTPVGGVKTLYKVGQGFLDKEKREKERLLAEQEEATKDKVRLPGDDPEHQAADPQSEDVADDLEEPEFQTFAEAENSDEDEPSPRYRPRMQFDA